MTERLIDLKTLVTGYLATFGIRILAAVALWVVGGWVINALGRVAQKAMEHRRVDATLIRYSHTGLNVILRIGLVIAILSVVGIETTSFAALIAAAGVAIGMAWSGLLANFAAGAFLMILRPFKVGDDITGANVTGLVREIGLFTTTIDTLDNLRVTVGNNKLFNDTIINYSANPFRRVDLTAQLAHGVDPLDAIERIRTAITAVDNVLAAPLPEVEILEFNSYGTKLVVRPYCHDKSYWQVYFDTNKALNAAGKAAGWPTPSLEQTNRNITVAS